MVEAAGASAVPPAVEDVAVGLLSVDAIGVAPADEPSAVSLRSLLQQAAARGTRTAARAVRRVVRDMASSCKDVGNGDLRPRRKSKRMANRCVPLQVIGIQS